MNELIKFYQSLMQEVIAMQSGDEDGDTQEQVFTRICHPAHLLAKVSLPQGPYPHQASILGRFLL